MTMITVVSDLATQAIDQRAVAMDGPLEEMLPVIAQVAEDQGATCVGLIVMPNVEVAFAQNLDHSVHLETMASIDELAGLRPDMVVVGPSAMLGCIVGEVVDRIHAALPGARVVCATGLRLDLFP